MMAILETESSKHTYHQNMPLVLLGLLSVQRRTVNSMSLRGSDSANRGLGHQVPRR
ncbi:hypothetical protein BDZ89DRAFT_1057439 [Hymenopellis radicata]|nr:hypothetical protein BDZ89DRAFT_1057439 [Hymenopellis radicata]